MQITKTTKARTGGFTLVEMIGVLAIIAILTSLLIPKIFQVINDAKISNALVSYNSAKAAAAAHYGKWGGFREANGTAISSYPREDWDDVLVSGGYLETPFAVKIGNGQQGATSGSRLRVVDISSLTSSSSVTAGDSDTSGSYCLTENTNTTSVPHVDTTGSYLVEAVIPGVSIQDAVELNRRIDGAAAGFGQQTWTNNVTADFTGRVKWQKGSGGEATVYMYIAHR
jgi:prepilin-type N-terminal cleavage/methylation domain-containing protein